MGLDAVTKPLGFGTLKLRTVVETMPGFTVTPHRLIPLVLAGEGVPPRLDGCCWTLTGSMTAAVDVGR